MDLSFCPFPTFSPFFLPPPPLPPNPARIWVTGGNEQNRLRRNWRQSAAPIFRRIHSIRIHPLFPHPLSFLLPSPEMPSRAEKEEDDHQQMDPRHPFNENAPEYFPSACCEFLHVQSALYLASFIQLAFVLTLSLLYLLLEQSQFINAVDVFRPGVVFVVCINLAGILCSLVGVCMQRDQLISIQITLLLGLVCLSDLFAFTLVATMAFGSRISFGNFDAKHLVQSLLVNEHRWESFLGPFWPYLLAILFHMSACAMICFVSVYRRYGQYLRHKYAVVPRGGRGPIGEQRH